MHREYALPFVVMLSSFFLVSGCVTQSQIPRIESRYYPQCVVPFNELQESEKALRNREIRYVTAGVVTGASTGALFGFMAGKNLKTTLIGGVAGAVTGGLAGFTVARIQEIKDRRERIAAYQSSMEVDLHNASDVEIAALRSLRCYVSEFDQLRKQFSDQLITKEDFSQRYAEIRMGIMEIGKITSNSQTVIALRDAEFRQAMQAEASREMKRKPVLATVDEKRAVEHRKAQRARKNTSPARGRKGKSARVARASSENASARLANLQNELERLEANAQQNRVTSRAVAQQETKSDMNVYQLAQTYNKFPEQVARLEAVEQQRRMTLQIMAEAAEKTGIDMV